MSSDESTSPPESVISPFADADTRPDRKRKKGNVGILIGLTVLIIAILGIGGFFLSSRLNDPLRTLEPFPVAKYLESYKTLAGSKFRGNVRVENDLGWKDGTGRLMVFSLREDPRPIVALIPPSLAGTYFTKGQTYAAELEVREGGLIYANTIRKD